MRKQINPSLRALAFVSGLVWLIAAAALAVEPSQEILLWPNGAPGSEGKTGDERVRLAGNGERVLSNIHKPNVTPYLPPAGKATGCAVIVAPGGGHRELWSDHEGHNVARWLSDHGIAAFVLKYRLARETNSTYTIEDHALADMQRAIRLVRSRATEWRLATNHIGVMGFSAGGELAFHAAQADSVAAHPLAPSDGERVAGGRVRGSSNDAIDSQSSRPDFQALIYPGRSDQIEPTSNSPPVFLACGYADRKDIAEGLAAVYLKFKQVKVPAELHIYSGSGHGFGLRPNDPKPAGKWIERFEEWLADSGFLKKP